MLQGSDTVATRPMPATVGCELRFRGETHALGPGPKLLSSTARCDYSTTTGSTIVPSAATLPPTKRGIRRERVSEAVGEVGSTASFLVLYQALLVGGGKKVLPSMGPVQGATGNRTVTDRTTRTTFTGTTLIEKNEKGVATRTYLGTGT